MRAFLLCLFLSAAVLPVMAQDDSTQATVQKPDERIMFQSKVRQLNSYLKENNERAAAILFKDVANDMQAFVDKGQTIADSTDDHKLQDKVDRQRQLLSQFKSFQPHLIRNRSSIETWTDQFVKTLYSAP